MGQKKKPGDAPEKPQRKLTNQRPDVPLTDDPPEFDAGEPVLPGGVGGSDEVGGGTMQLPPPTGAQLAYDIGKNPVALFANEWSANYFAQTNPRVPLSSLPVQTASGNL